MIKNIIKITIVILTLGVISLFVSKYYKPQYVVDYVNKLKVISSDECSDINEYTTIGDIKVYTHCVDSVLVTNKNNPKDIELKDFLLKYGSLETFIKTETNLSKEDNSGSLYKGNDYIIIKCTSDNYYISTKDITLEYCKP